MEISIVIVGNTHTLKGVFDPTNPDERTRQGVVVDVLPKSRASHTYPSTSRLLLADVVDAPDTLSLDDIKQVLLANKGEESSEGRQWVVAAQAVPADRFEDLMNTSRGSLTWVEFLTITFNTTTGVALKDAGLAAEWTVEVTP